MEVGARLHEAEELKPTLVELRRSFHRRPELGFRETETARLVRCPSRSRMMSLMRHRCRV
jgi:hypothetical protein